MVRRRAQWFWGCAAALVAVFCGCTGPLIYRPAAKVTSSAKGGQGTGSAALPPEPDPKVNNATLAGVVSSGVGVRDDVYLWIYANYTATRKRAILMGMAKDLQQLVVSPPKTAQDAASFKRGYDDALLSLKALPGLSPKAAEEMDSNLNLQLVNTKSRLNSYLQYNLLLEGGKGKR